MFKIILFILAIFLIYVIFFKKSKNMKNKEDSGNEEFMIECKKCKTYISKDESILSNGFYFCCKECVK